MIKIQRFSSDVITWNPVSSPPREFGKYLVLGLTTYVPDHNGEPDSIWGITTATYTVFGWSTKIKCWAKLPALPKEYAKYINKKTYYNRVRW